MKGRFDFDRVKMTKKIIASFHKGEKFIPAYAGQKIRFIDGISDPLTPQQIQWALSVKDGMQFEPFRGVPKLESPTKIGDALPPPPPDLDLGDGLNEGTGTEETGDGDGGEGDGDEKYAGEKAGVENIADYSAKDAILTVEGEETPENLDFYIEQEKTLGGKARKTVLNAIEARKAELAE